MVLILSAPPVAPPVPPAQWVGLGIEWVAPDGTVWDLTDPSKGVVLVRDGVEGLHFPRVEKFSSASRAIPGKRSRGWRALARDVFWRVYIYRDSSAAWLELYRRFFDSIHPDRVGTWRVTAGDQTRELRLTGTFDEPWVYDRDPLYRGWALYGVAMEADQPFWAGAPIKRGPWRAPAPVPFFDADGSPPLHISQGSTFASARIPNAGDVDAWPVWTLEGPLDPVEVGIGEAIVQVPFPILDGQVLRIDTDPRNVTATLDGADVTRLLGFQRFAPVPPGGEVPLHVAAAGGGAVSVELVPLYFRAF
ncbi:hypothetical protein [Microbacterium album]|uniref:Phage tail protein n=1 Tax=Microbacterium album TaxID=2053191 RepID=A0A917IB56_9MICO|nr:hypothetical protein [Microbacterium album]GGH34252.1 hypothetical protein GCM10010921_01810 [Microbacterium album]